MVITLLIYYIKKKELIVAKRLLKMSLYNKLLELAELIIKKHCTYIKLN